jgi:hypothetical protein
MKPEVDPETPLENAAAKKRLDPVERRKAVKETSATGLSIRAIADQLGFDEATVRRDLKVLNLPEKLRILAEQGVAVEPLLRRDRRQRKQAQELAHRAYVAKEQNRRLIEERRDGRHSDAISNAALAWLCKATCNGQVIDFARDEKINLVHAVAKNLWQQYVYDLACLPPSNYWRVIEALEDDDPLGEVSEFTETINHYEGMLTKIMLGIAPEREVRNAAMDKMRAAVD